MGQILLHAITFEPRTAVTWSLDSGQGVWVLPLNGLFGGVKASASANPLWFIPVQWVLMIFLLALKCLIWCLVFFLKDSASGFMLLHLSLCFKKWSVISVIEEGSWITGVQ